AARRSALLPGARAALDPPPAARAILRRRPGREAPGLGAGPGRRLGAQARCSGYTGGMGSLLIEPTGQGWIQILELVSALVLSALIGLERELRRKSAGLRTHTLIGFSSALIMLVSKYGFTDVLGDHIVL